jgi:hypothetical protein
MYVVDRKLCMKITYVDRRRRRCRWEEQRPEAKARRNPNCINLIFIFIFFINKIDGSSGGGGGWSVYFSQLHSLKSVHVLIPQLSYYFQTGPQTKTKFETMYYFNTKNLKKRVNLLMHDRWGSQLKVLFS